MDSTLEPEQLEGLEDHLLARAQFYYTDGRLACQMKEHCVGIDVAKDWFDGAILGEKRTQQFARTKQRMAKLVQQLTQVKPKLVVVEASGGYEEALVLGLFEAGLPVRQ